MEGTVPDYETFQRGRAMEIIPNIMNMTHDSKDTKSQHIEDEVKKPNTQKRAWVESNKNLEWVF